jgi:monoamine oxidase
MIYDIIIIGSGISGLYNAYKLLKIQPSLKILILEKNDYFGGRIKTRRITIQNHKYTFEEGAGRFNENHKLLINLIKELNLEKNIIKINSDITFIPSTKYQEKFIGKSPFEFIKIVINKSKEELKENLIKYTFIEYCEKILNKETIKFILDSFGYYDQLVKMNAFDCIKLLDKGMISSLQFYSLSNGLDQIIDNLLLNIKDKCKILKKHNVSKIDYLDNIFKIYCNKKIFRSKICIISVPKPNLLKFNFLKKYFPLFKSIGTKSLCRIYSIFDKKDIWFKNIYKTTTNSNSRYIIPIDKNNGLILISYTDSKFADYWIKIKDENILINKLTKNIYKIFKKKINKPIFTKVCYWKLGTGFWLKNKDSKIISSKIIQLNNLIPLFISGENYSETQGWIEGALETSEIVINKILQQSSKI